VVLVEKKEERLDSELIDALEDDALRDSLKEALSSSL